MVIHDIVDGAVVRFVLQRYTKYEWSWWLGDAIQKHGPHSTRYRLVDVEHITTVNPTLRPPGELLNAFRQLKYANEAAATFWFNKQIESAQRDEAVFTFTLHMIPLGAFGDYATQGEWGEAAISVSGDAAMLLTGFLSKAATTARTVQKARAAKAGIGLIAGAETSISGLRIGQGVGAVIDGETGQAAGYFGEAALRLLGAGDAVRHLRKIPRGGRTVIGRISTTVDDVDLPNQVAMDFIDDHLGRRGGELYGANRLNKLDGYLDRRGDIKLFLDNPRLPPGKRAGFNAELGELSLPHDATKYEVWHELAHYAHYKRIGRDAYLQLRAKGKEFVEQEVFDTLRRNPRRWNELLTLLEKVHAEDYLERMGGTPW